MTTWEYYWLVAGTDPFDSVEVNNRKYRIDEYLNILGEDGWELVSVTLQNGSVTTNRRFTYWFKRPKS